MENPRPEKVAVVDEVRSHFEQADAVLVTEYRGLKVSELASLRQTMRPAGGEYRVYKNTLVRFATRSLDIDIESQLTGPTALAFVSTKADGSPGDIAAVAKALTEFAKGNPLLVLKGGILGDAILDAAEAKALASLPTAPEIYARLAGAINSGARGLASVVSGMHRSLAYVLQAAIDAGAFAGDAPAPEAAAETAAPETDAVETGAVESETVESTTEATDAVAEPQTEEADPASDEPPAPAAEAAADETAGDEPDETDTATPAESEESTTEES
jgi:large subunit ribosomal protein L10